MIGLAVPMLCFTHSSTCVHTALQELGEHESSLTNPEPEFPSPKIVRDSIEEAPAEQYFCCFSLLSAC